ncbi:MAG: ABC transporter permease [Candidatus Rokubacteria bacterium]|nr:ABC transporter permease [Candidatus Rokubacteria bacterium]
MPPPGARDLSKLYLLGPPLVFLGLVFAFPLVQVIWGSFFAPEFTVQYYARMVRVSVYAQVFWITFKISALTTLFCLLLGYATAYFLASLPPYRRQLALLCVVVPFFISLLVRNYIWMILLGRNGLVNSWLLTWSVISQPLELMYNELGVLIAMVHMLLPYMIFPILSALLAIPPELIHASGSLGAGALRTFIRITLPLSLPGVAAGVLLVFIVALGFFITPALLGGPKQMMISNLIEFNIRQVLNWPFGFALSNTLLSGTLLLYFLYVRLLKGRLPAVGFP